VNEYMKPNSDWWNEAGPQVHAQGEGPYKSKAFVRDWNKLPPS